MRGFRLSRPVAIACLAGAGWTCRPHAAEYSVAPTMGLSMDYASNRYLQPQAVPGDGAFVNLDAQLRRTTDTLVLNAQPSFSLQRYTNHSAINSDNGALNLSATSLHEFSTYGLTAGYSDLSTLTTELESTGVVQGNTHQRQANAGASWQYLQSERRQLTMQATYTDVRYFGQQAQFLPGYRSPGASIAERFTLSALTTLTITASSSELRSSGAAGNTVDGELDLGLNHSFSDRIQAVASVGRSERRSDGVLTGGYVGEAQLTRNDERNQWRLSYQRSVVPTGFGNLVQRDAGSLSLSRPLSERLSGDVSILSTRDRSVFFFGLLQEGRRYDTAEGGLNWITSETSTIGLRIGYDRAAVSSLIPVPQARGWRAAANVHWTPRPRSISR